MPVKLKSKLFSIVVKKFLHEIYFIEKIMKISSGLNCGKFSMDKLREISKEKL